VIEEGGRPDLGLRHGEERDEHLTGLRQRSLKEGGKFGGDPHKRLQAEQEPLGEKKAAVLALRQLRRGKAGASLYSSARQTHLARSAKKKSKDGGKDSRRRKLSIHSSHIGEYASNNGCFFLHGPREPEL